MNYILSRGLYLSSSSASAAPMSIGARAPGRGGVHSQGPSIGTLGRGRPGGTSAVVCGGAVVVPAYRYRVRITPASGSRAGVHHTTRRVYRQGTDKQATSGGSRGESRVPAGSNGQVGGRSHCIPPDLPNFPGECHVSQPVVRLGGSGCSWLWRATTSERAVVRRVCTHRLQSVYSHRTTASPPPPALTSAPRTSHPAEIQTTGGGRRSGVAICALGVATGDLRARALLCRMHGFAPWSRRRVTVC